MRAPRIEHSAITTCITVIATLGLMLTWGSCSSDDSSTDGDPRPASGDVTLRMIDLHGEDGAFDAMVLSFDQGYSLRQLVDGVEARGLLADGVITDETGVTTSPSGRPSTSWRRGSPREPIEPP